MSLYVHPKWGHIVDAARGIVFKKKVKGVLVPLAMTMNKAGYLCVPTGSRKSRYTSTVHRHVWEAANGTLVPKGFDVHHKNHDKTDNRLTNLELVTRSDNAKAFAALRRAKREASKISDRDKLEIWESDPAISAESWAAELNVDAATIDHVRKGGFVDLPANDADAIRKRYGH